jgi:hypothetical protein
MRRSYHARAHGLRGGLVNTQSLRWSDRMQRRHSGEYQPCAQLARRLLVACARAIYVKGIPDIENIVLRSDSGTPVLIKDVARVALGPEMRRGIADYGGASSRPPPRPMLPRWRPQHREAKPRQGVSTCYR